MPTHPFNNNHKTRESFQHDLILFTLEHTPTLCWRGFSPCRSNQGINLFGKSKEEKKNWANVRTSKLRTKNHFPNEWKRLQIPPFHFLTEAVHTIEPDFATQLIDAAEQTALFIEHRRIIHDLRQEINSDERDSIASTNPIEDSTTPSTMGPSSSEIIVDDVIYLNPSPTQRHWASMFVVKLVNRKLAGGIMGSSYTVYGPSFGSVLGNWQS